MTSNGVKERVSEFVRTSLRRPDLKDTDDIFEIGGASSLFAAELVVFVEGELGVELEDDDLVRENFATIDAVNRLVGRTAST